MSPRNPLHLPVELPRHAPVEPDEDGHLDVTRDDDIEPDFDDPEYNGRYGPKPTYW